MASKFEELSPITRKLAERLETSIMDMNARLADGDGMTGEQILQCELAFTTEAIGAAIVRLEIKLDTLAELCGYDIQLMTDDET